MSKGRILVVDDQRYFRELLEALLCDEGYEVVAAEGGAQALEHIRHEDFDVVISDLVMPEIDGVELVERIRRVKADQEIVMVTGAADMKAAAAAMALGANDFILKPFDRATLRRSLDRLMHQRTLREEHAELMARNLEYMAALSLYERAAGLFSAPGLEALSERLLDALCMETRGQGAVLWLADGRDDPRLRLASVRGLVRVDREPAEISIASLPEALGESLRLGQPKVVNDPTRSSLFVPLRDEERMLGLVRISDKLEGAQFSESDRTQADRFTQIASAAVANGLRVRALERRSFRDPSTGAYTIAYLHDVAHNEIRKAARFGRPLSIVRVRLAAVDDTNRTPTASEREQWLESASAAVASLLRATDLTGVSEDGCIDMLLPETDGIGAATLKHRLLPLLLDCRGGSNQPFSTVALSASSYPADGADLEAMLQTLDRRNEDHLHSPARRFESGDEDLASVLSVLRSESGPAPERLPGQVTELLCREIARRPHDRALLFAHPDPAFGWETSLRRLAESVRKDRPRTQIVVLGDARIEEREALGALALTWASPAPLGAVPPFLLYCGEGPSYVAIGGEQGAAFFQSSDRALAEHLSLRLQHELGVGASGA